MKYGYESEMYSMIRRYDRAKSTKVGKQVQCPTCCKMHVKTTYHKVFCSNGRTHGAKNCKDGFWNFPGVSQQMYKIKRQMKELSQY